MKIPYIVNQDAIPMVTHVEQDGIKHYIGEVRVFDRHPELRTFLERGHPPGLSFATLKNGEEHHPHTHEVDSMVIVMLGAATLTGTEEKTVREGDVICIPQGVPHGFRCDLGVDLIALSIQHSAKPLFEDTLQANIRFVSNANHFKDKLLALNTQRCDAMLASPFFTLLKTGALSSPDKLAHFYKHLRMWSDKFQRILFMRQATVADGRFEQVFKQHLFEEIGHNDMLPTSDEWDAVVDTCGDWFVMKMLVLDNREKLAVVQLVLEKCGDLYHSMAKSALKIDDDYIDTHAKHDHSHAELGMELFDGIDETTYSQLARLCSQSWDVLEMMLNRIAALAK